MRIAPPAALDRAHTVQLEQPRRFMGQEPHGQPIVGHLIFIEHFQRSRVALSNLSHQTFIRCIEQGLLAINTHEGVHCIFGLRHWTFVILPPNKGD